MDGRLPGELSDGGWVIDLNLDEPLYGPPKATPLRAGEPADDADPCEDN